MDSLQKFSFERGSVRPARVSPERVPVGTPGPLEDSSGPVEPTERPELRLGPLRSGPPQSVGTALTTRTGTEVVRKEKDLSVGPTTQEWDVGHGLKLFREGNENEILILLSYC